MSEEKRAWSKTLPFTAADVIQDKEKLVSFNRLPELLEIAKRENGVMIIQQTAYGGALRSLNGWVDHYTKIDIPFAVFQAAWTHSGKTFYGIVKERIVEDRLEPAE